jgi:hypothetical protein
MSWLSSFLHPGKGYEKGQEQLGQYYNQAQGYGKEAQGYLNPYNQNGQEAYGGLSEAMKALLDPQALQDKWSKGYQESEGAKQAEGMATEHGLDAASSMGLMGSSPALQAIQGGTTKIGLDESNNYMDNLMQKYLAGIGVGQGIYGTGANAASGMSNNAMNMGNNAMKMGENSANMAYGKQNAGGNMFANLLGMVGGAAGSALGGPIGGALAKRWNLAGG